MQPFLQVCHVLSETVGGVLHASPDFNFSSLQPNKPVCLTLTRRFLGTLLGSRLLAYTR